VAMSPEERAAVREDRGEEARRSRIRQGLPERIEGPAAVATLAAILRGSPTPRHQSKSLVIKGNWPHSHNTSGGHDSLKNRSRRLVSSLLTWTPAARLQSCYFPQVAQQLRAVEMIEACGVGVRMSEQQIGHIVRIASRSDQGQVPGGS
jgi:hypothetical protein